MLIAALHDADERADGSFRAAIEQMFADGRFAFFFGSHVHNAFAFAGEQIIKVFRCAMKFLRAEHQVHVR